MSEKSARIKKKMALVTIQRSPVAGSPQCSNSDGEADDEEGSRHEKSECFFAGKGTALVLALKDIPQNFERRLSTDSIKSTNSTQSNNSDIQQHLQSMFNLLSHEETLKMAVKLESQRPNRTRYLVIASRCCYRTATTERKSKITRHNSMRVTSSTASNTFVTSGGGGSPPTARQLSVDSSSNNNRSSSASALLAQQTFIEQSQCDGNESGNAEGCEKRLSSISTGSIRQSVKCDADKNSACGDGCKECDEEGGIEESCLLGIDCNERTTIGLVVAILADTTIHLDGDGGFSVSVFGKTHIFKPVSVQAMWSALQTLHKVSQKARENNFYPSGPSHDWLSYYQSRIESDQSCLNEWNTMDSIESRRPPSPDAIRNKPTAKDETEVVIKMKLKEIMMSVDLDEVTSKYIRGRLEEHLDMDLGEYKSFIDEEMLMILGQMDAPTQIFEHVYLGSEWNASNLEELQKNGVRHILNVTREIDNFFPGMFDYFNVRVYDDEKTNLLKHWDNTYRYINNAKAEGSKVLVHCKMGVSRSASVVIAYAMKAYNWEFQKALHHVKERRNCIKPNKNFLTQLETYSGMLYAMKNKEKLQRSKSETNLKSTKDARLLPGSEPTPLIQALNQSKSKSTGHAVSNDVNESVVSSASISRCGSSTDQKHRRLLRRSSSTSPKSIPSQSGSIVMKQQSQSLENLTPERNVPDEPKNVRFPGSNGENYSVTQNQVLHLQKNTPPPPPPPPPPMPLTKHSTAPTSVRTIVHGLEAYKDTRKTADDRKTLNLQISVRGAGSLEGNQPGADEISQAPPSASSVRSLGSPVWTSSAKLITQTSNLKAQRSESDTTSRLGSNSSIDSASSCATTTMSAPVYEGFMRHRPRQRELPSRHASWGSGDNRLPTRNSSWGSYDTNRNTFQYGSNAANSAIFEGQVHELNTSYKTAANPSSEESHPQHYHHHLGTVKRTKQKLEVSTAQKKLCQGNEQQTEKGAGKEGDKISTVPTLTPQKKGANLVRSVSAVGSTRSRYPQRCNSDEIMAGLPPIRRSEGSRPLQSELYAQQLQGTESYCMSDIENKNMPQQEVLGNNDDDDDEELAGVVLRTTQVSAGANVSEDKRISGNVQILKKNFEAKASGKAGGGGGSSSATTKKGHQSLPSSPVAQHVDHSSVMPSTTNTTTTPAATTMTAQSPYEQIVPTVSTTNTTTTMPVGSSRSSSSSSSASCSSASEPCDRNVKGLVHKYQATASIPIFSNTSTTSIPAAATLNNSKQRPRSCYENQKIQRSITGRPPPAPTKCLSTGNSALTSITLQQQQQHAQQQQQQHQPQRRLQQHGKTHPLTKLSLPKHNLNTAAYNTM